MPRVVNPEEHSAKRAAILDAAAALIFEVGYERMAIRHILDRLGISRGAMYHYFDSKAAILEALVDRMGSDAAEALLPIVHDPQLPAAAKFRRYIDASAELKAGHAELIVNVLRGWYRDENIVVRHKLTSGTLRYTAPMILEPIIHQGVSEGAFDAPYPAHAARLIASMSLTVADEVADLLLAGTTGDALAESAGAAMGAYLDAVERVLGAPGALGTPDTAALRRLVAAMDQQS
jgi:AcrR family transcriptional regulator